MIRNGVYTVADIDTRAPRRAAPASDSRPAPRRPATTRVDVFNVILPKPAAPKRVNVADVAAKLAAVTKALRSKPEPQATAAAQRPIDPRYDPTSASLAEMNRRGRAFWYGEK
jgi:hypothetical protein